MKKPSPNCLLMFDFDGVISDSLNIFEESLKAACRENGFPVIQNREDFLRIFDHNMVAGLTQLGIPAPQIGPLLQTLGNRLVQGMEQCPPFPGIPAIITQLADTHPVYVITSNLTAVVSAYLTRHGIQGIRAVLGSDLEASKQIKIRKIVAQCPDCTPFYMGDTLGDMDEAHAAGVQAVAVLWGWHNATRLRQGCPDHLLHSPTDLLSLCRATASISRP